MYVALVFLGHYLYSNIIFWVTIVMLLLFLQYYILGQLGAQYYG